MPSKYTYLVWRVELQRVSVKRFLWNLWADKWICWILTKKPVHKKFMFFNLLEKRGDMLQKKALLTTSTPYLLFIHTISCVCLLAIHIHNYFFIISSYSYTQFSCVSLCFLFIHTTIWCILFGDLEMRRHTSINKFEMIRFSSKN